MKKKFAFYCSGGASRVLKFYLNTSINKFKPEFVFYDGDNTEVINRLKNIFKNLLCLVNEKKSISDELLYVLNIHKVDYLFCFGDQILRGKLLEVYKNRIINFHPSLLPSFPGLYSIDQALNSNVQILGNTAHFIDKGIDTGPIIMQSAISRKIYTNYEDVLCLQLEMLKRIWELLNQDLIKVEENLVVINKEIDKEILFTI